MRVESSLESVRKRPAKSFLALPSVPPCSLTRQQEHDVPFLPFSPAPVPHRPTRSLKPSRIRPILGYFSQDDRTRGEPKVAGWWTPSSLLGRLCSPLSSPFTGKFSFPPLSLSPRPGALKLVPERGKHRTQLTNFQMSPRRQVGTRNRRLLTAKTR